MSFDRERCLNAFRLYREETGSDVGRSPDELAAMPDADLALYAAGVFAAFQSVAAASGGNGEKGLLAPPVMRLALGLHEALGG